ncbi:dihydrofolate reductase family protein [Natrialba sp. PRR66]|uniref:dihydrofolate reductase family protein n=1 Tax=Natrialba sp. PRR66 TaxID=3098146 RepID=UPI002B1E8A07|nr:dihydrofolate reductase family protein [Natrialba sp. PRR66]
MSELLLYIAASVDGFIATPDGGVDWLDEFQQESDVANSDDDGFDEFFASVDCLVMGSRTYEQVLEFGAWPYEDRPTYVLTSRELPLASDAVSLVDEEPAELVADLRANHDRIWLVGGGALVRSMLRANCVDELRLHLVPVRLGGGISLFGTDEPRRDLELLETTTRGGGLVELRYRIESATER